MRRIGTLTDPELARRFADYLMTRSIECRVDVEPMASPKSGGSGAGKSESGKRDVSCDLWVRDETHIDQAREELAAFLDSPQDEKYKVGGRADRIRKEREEEEKRKKRLQKKVQPRSPAAGAGQLMGVRIRQQSIPVVISVIVLSVIASFSTGFGRPAPSPVPGEPSVEESLFYGLSFVDWRDYLQSGEDPLASIRQGQVWRLITPMFLHGDTYHLAFNMLGIFFLGSVIERLQGSVFMLALLLISQLAGGLLQIALPPAEELPELLAGLAGSPFSIGASGAVYGVFGYLWIRPSLSPSYPVRMMPMNVTIMMGWLVFCVFFVPRIANGAHIGGLIAGVLIAAIVSRMSIDSYS